MTMAGCQGGVFEAGSVCFILGGIQTWTKVAALSAGGCLFVAMGAEYARDTDETGEVRTAVKSKKGESSNNEC